MTIELEPLDIGAFLEKAISINAAYGDKFSVRFNLKRPVPGEDATFNFELPTV